MLLSTWPDLNSARKIKREKGCKKKQQPGQLFSIIRPRQARLRTRIVIEKMVRFYCLFIAFAQFDFACS